MSQPLHRFYPVNLTSLVHRFLLFSVMSTLFCGVSIAGELHVSVGGQDSNDGSKDAPYRTISAAAAVAQPGDTVIVHEGTYRERVNPPRGGTSDNNRIVYRAAKGEDVVIKGSELVDDWTHVDGDVWETTLPNAFFGTFNPYNTHISGHWYDPQGHKDLRGAVYINEKWIPEVYTFDGLFERNKPGWAAKVDENTTTIRANFGGANPNEQMIEINVREAIFYPEKPGRNYITVRGFTMKQAATPWAPPTTEQVGLIGTHWSKGWVIEDNEISHSRCVGITLGKYDDLTGDREMVEQSAGGYITTIRRAREDGWSRENIGHHVVRNNDIHHCEQAGIVGSMGAVFSRISGNHIYQIHQQGLFTGAEMSGIKLHAPINTLIARNHIHDSGHHGIWIDWMSQGTRVTRNLLYNNGAWDIFSEVNHGPYLVDHNLLLSNERALRIWSHGGAYVHNLVMGKVQNRRPGRDTPYQWPNSTRLAGIGPIREGGVRFFNNTFVGHNGLSPYDSVPQDGDVFAGGNLYLNGASPSKHDQRETVSSSVDPELDLIRENGDLHLKLLVNDTWLSGHETRPVTTWTLGAPETTEQPYTRIDGRVLRFPADYRGQQRDENHPSVGPFELEESGSTTIQVWPMKSDSVPTGSND